MELDHLHVPQTRPSLVCQHGAVAGGFPGIGRKLVHTTPSARSQTYRLCFKTEPLAAVSVIAERSHNPSSILDEPRDGLLHVEGRAKGDRFVLKGSNELQAGAVSDVV